MIQTIFSFEYLVLLFELASEGGAHDAMIIVARNAYSNQSSNPGRGYLR